MKIFTYTLHEGSVTQIDRDRKKTELDSLIKTHGGFEVVQQYEKRGYPDYHVFIGTGKLEEIRNEMLTSKAEVLIVNNILKPQQIFQLNRYLEKDKIQVRDRVDLILGIFKNHANTMESRLQIELAAIKHMGPRIFNMGFELSRQGGGSAITRGVGETNTEIMKRHLKEKERLLKKKLEEYSQTRKLHRSARRRHGLPVIGIVGYTNAGKSTLFTALCNKAVEREDKLFATLGTHFGAYHNMNDLGEKITFLVNDTIGFIDDLPPDLIQAFRSTLEESVYADMLLHVIDAGDEHYQRKIQIVDEILSQIQPTSNQYLVFNKIDSLTDVQLEELKTKYPQGIFVSAISKIGINQLISMIIEQVLEQKLPDDLKKEE